MKEWGAAVDGDLGLFRGSFGAVLKWFVWLLQGFVRESWAVGKTMRGMELFFGLNEGLLLLSGEAARWWWKGRKHGWFGDRNTEVGGGEFVVFFGPVVVGFGREKEDSFFVLFYFDNV